MVEEVGKKVKKDAVFHEVVMAVVSQNVNVRDIQGKLADRLDLQLKKETEDGRAGELWNRLNNDKQNLVILDDVWEELNLKAVGIPVTDGIKGCCKVVLTSRNQAALEDKDEYAWADALKQLRDSDIDGVDSRLYSSLKLSYNYLQSQDARRCFLLCCLFREDAEISIDDLARYGLGMRFFKNVRTLKEASNRVHTLVGTLKTCCLLLEGSIDKNKVKMHDVFRDVAISIARDNEAFMVRHGVDLEEWPERDEYQCSRLCFNNNFTCFFNGTRELKVLDLSYMLFRLLPSSLSNLSNLRMLCLRDCKLEDVSMLKDLKNLEMLSLRGSSIKRLSPEIRHLTRLRLLDLQSL
ncbi:hypothetical protein F0562_017488 [Nyssa sinensis]|uniref:NB-ARC domain-containing protein n=1 Tax=Nyssa sinensis TaxID=561372 RepID=A0A5J4ZF66_9ASTE|nr:hypothetical protein F0562_017488 [Nyssa sinensis]